MRHTQGEWESTWNSAQNRSIRTPSGFICFLPMPTHYDGQDERYDQEIDENEANAKLIAVAPKLLENLIRCVARLDELGFGHMSAVTRAKEAIKKATE